MTTKGRERLYNIVLKSSASKDLDKLNDPYLSKIIFAIENLKENPRNINVKKLIGRENEYTLRIGDYRVLFYIVDESKLIKISRVLHRREAYR